MALHAAYALMRRVQVGCIFRLHHCVAGLTAEICRIHILNASIRTDTEDDGIKNRQAAHPYKALPEKGAVKIQLRVFDRKLAGCPEFMTLPKCAGRNHRQADQKNARKNQDENEAN